MHLQQAAFSVSVTKCLFVFPKHYRENAIMLQLRKKDIAQTNDKLYIDQEKKTLLKRRIKKNI